MKIRVEHGDVDENEIILRCKKLDDEMSEVLSLLQDRSAKLSAQKDGETHMLKPDAVYYAETVEGRTFLYTADLVLEVRQSLTHLLEHYSENGFFRIGKSQLVNLYHVSKLKSLPNSRIEITLHSGERLIVARHYMQSLKEKLGMIE